MLKHFNAALSGLGKAHTLDHLADLAEVLLGAPVVLVALAPAPSVLGASTRARAALGNPADAEAFADRARSAPVSALPDNDAALLTSTDTGGPHPLARAVSLPLRLEAGSGLVLLCTEGVGLRVGAVRAAIAVLQRAVADAVAADRHRAHLVRFARMFDNMERAARIGVWEVNRATGTLFWSDEVFRIHEMTPGEPPTVAEALLFYPEPARSRLSEALGRTEATEEPCDLVLPFTTAEGNKRIVRVIATLQKENEGPERIAGVFQDVTAQEEATERLRWTANHDVLTGLPNRALFADRFRKALEHRSRTGAGLVLVLIDVDHFKAVNDTLGHAAGDELLRMIALGLKRAVRTSDTVARTGGDEFSVLLEDVSTEGDLAPVLACLREAMCVRLTWGERTMIVSMSGGVAIAPDHGRSERELGSAADLALYRAKDVRRGALVVFEPALGQALQERNRLLAALRQALEEGRIVPWYQPQIDVVSGRIVGVEALARWITDEGVKTAADFVGAMSDHEIGTRIGAAVVDRAIAEIAALNAPRADKIALSVNASAGELARARFLERIGIEASRDGGGGPITVEITEDVILDDPDGLLVKRLEAARAAGVRFSLDDFGTGYASLLHVSTLPISEVKIDRRFVAGLGTDPSRQKVVRGIIDVARALDLRVILEGVETEAQVGDIVALGGRFLQGFYYSRAVPLDELERLLAAEARRLDAAA